VRTINIQEAKTHLSRLVEEALAGQQIIIGKAGKPLVVLTPYAAPVKARAGGQFRGRIREAPDCWAGDELADSIDAPLYGAARRKAARVAEGRPS